ncbi:MAG: SH3 domain-containing protein [Candidatus Omnitrophica bacterium]|nr:SH3 domain-containing protein [Candidatus Omnitrophota bacterium]
MKGFPWVLVVTVIFCFPLLCAGDTLLLKSGDQIIGTIVSMTDQEVIVDVNGVPVSIKRADILEIVRSGEAAGPAFPPVSLPPVQATQEIQTPLTTPWSSTPISPAPGETLSSLSQPLLPVVMPAGKAYQVIGAGVRFRKGPSLDYEVIDSLPGQTVLLEIEFVDNWLHAKTVDGVEGWIHPSFVRPMENIPCLVNGDRLHVREAPDELSLSLDRLRRGDVVIKLEERGDWWFILSGDSTVGWCSRQYLSPMEDQDIYLPPMRIAGNSDLGMPILVDRKPMAQGIQQVNLTIRDSNCVQAGKAKWVVLHRDPALFSSAQLKYISEAIVDRERLPDALAILRTGLPKDVAVNFVGGDLLTMLGERTSDGWTYSLVLPDAPTIAFGLVVQSGDKRGTLVVIQ